MPENNTLSIICPNVNSTTPRLIRVNRKYPPSNAFTMNYLLQLAIHIYVYTSVVPVLSTGTKIISVQAIFYLSSSSRTGTGTRTVFCLRTRTGTGTNIFLRLRTRTGTRTINVYNN